MFRLRGAPARDPNRRAVPVTKTSPASFTDQAPSPAGVTAPPTRFFPAGRGGSTVAMRSPRLATRGPRVSGDGDGRGPMVVGVVVVVGATVVVVVGGSGNGWNGAGAGAVMLIR